MSGPGSGPTSPPRPGEVASLDAAAFRCSWRRAARCVFRTTLTEMRSKDAVLSSVRPPSTRWRNTCCCRRVRTVHDERGNCRYSPRGLRALHSPCRSRSERVSPAPAHRRPRHASRPPRSTPPPRCPVAPCARRPRRPHTPEAAPRRPSRRTRRPSTAIADSDGVAGSARGPRCTATQPRDSSSTGPGGPASAAGRRPTPPRCPRYPRCPPGPRCAGGTHGRFPTPTSIAAPWSASVHSGSVPVPAGCQRRRQRPTAAVLFTGRSSGPAQAAGPRRHSGSRSPRRTVKRP